ncbi:L-2-amino-thiazoline-4-carboxylic acid hydrolase [Shimazuella alba]|uniref:L-2-amino-thiazoline-4-carboxylic acid hydrolase n=1 Tax=Shimazuella alba TaxID=2690964 RepID=A0A6I4W050_9BACL|nr:L-2-amino-thiazoline-4-carboxylic acid hydrolase [Shimazuella alba]MXQ55600.1 hypothetical protein [Shimazuella alba]
MGKINQEQYHPDPAMETQMIVQIFLNVIEQELKEINQSKEIIKEINLKSKEIQNDHRDWIIDEPSRYHLETVAIVLSTYLILKSVWSKEEAFHSIRKAFIEPFREYGKEKTNLTLDSENPFRQIVDLSRMREQYFFGSTFTFERVQDDEHAYLLDVTNCFYHNFFSKNNAPELTAIFCEFDNIWIDSIDTKKHKFYFERTETMGLGGKKCPFYFYQGEKRDDK